MQPAIRVENLSKCYRITHAVAGRDNYRTLRESMAGAITAPFKRWMSNGNGNGNGADRGSGDEDFWALKDVSFEVQPGEVVGIIGRNGAGKSTLLKILSRITKPTGGLVTLHGRVGSLLEVGTGFHPELTGRENVFLNGSILGMSRQEISKQFDAIVDFSGVEKFLDTPVKRYSSGMYVRLAFAVAAHLNPEILIVDEVLAVGDAEFQKKCLGKMKEVADGGRTVLFVSHNIQAITQLTTRCILLSAGQLHFEGSTWDAVKVYDEFASSGEHRNYRYHCDPEKSGDYLMEAIVRTKDGNGIHEWGNPIQFEFVLNIDDPHESLCFSFQILNQGRQPICHLWHFDRTASFRSNAGIHRVIFSVPDFHLFIGDYTLTTWLTERRTDRLLENIADICPFSISMGKRNRPEYDWRIGDCAYLEDFDVTSQIIEVGDFIRAI